MRVVHALTRWIKLQGLFLAAAWRVRRDDAGGISDETAMIGLMLGAAVTVGSAIYWLVVHYAQGLSIGGP